MSQHTGRVIFTLGHSDHPIDRFLHLLARHRVDAVADVRSAPVSRFSPQYNSAELADRLVAAGLYYVPMGKELGARRKERACYVDGKAGYDRISRLSVFQQGVARLRDGATRLRIALLCAERDPLTCHRAILVCRHLRDPQLSIVHIGYDGELESHDCLEDRLLRTVRVHGQDLITSREAAVEYAYDLQSERIAYSRRGTRKDRKE